MSYLTKNLPYYHRVPIKLQDKWEWLFWPMLLVEVSAYFVVPFISIFYRYEVRTDTMKRLARDRGDERYTKYTKMREYLPKIFNWYQTHDNAADTYYWDLFDDSINERFGHLYEKSWLLRYYNRIRWHWRNKAYGASYTLFGAPKDDFEPEIFEVGKEDSGELWVRVETHPRWFLYEAQLPTDNGKYRNVKIGWKANRSAPPLKDGTYNVMYANRLAWLRRKQYK